MARRTNGNTKANTKAPPNRIREDPSRLAPVLPSLVWLMLGAVACGGSQGNRGNAASGSQNEVVVPLRPFTVSSSDESFIIAPKAAAPPTISSAGQFFRVDIPIGRGKAVACRIYRDTKTLSSILRRMAASRVRAPQARIVRLEAQHDQGVAQLQVDLSLDGQAFVLRAAYRHRSVVFCEAEPSGHFEEVFASLIASLVVAGSTDQASLSYAELRLQEDNTGQLKSAALVGVSGKERPRRERSLSWSIGLREGDIDARDQESVVDLDRDGGLRRGLFSASFNGDSLYELKVERSARYQYRVRGDYEGAPVNYRFVSKKPLLGFVGTTRELRRIANANKAGAHLALRGYWPALSVDRPTPMVYDLTRKGGPVDLKIGPVAMQCDLESTGLLGDCTTELPDRKVSTKRVWQEGSVVR